MPEKVPWSSRSRNSSSGVLARDMAPTNTVIAKSERNTIGLRPKRSPKDPQTGPIKAAINGAPPKQRPAHSSISPRSVSPICSSKLGKNGKKLIIPSPDRKLAIQTAVNVRCQELMRPAC
jgi:hypothetical protein